MNESEWRDFEAKPPVECVRVKGIDLKRGDRVRLVPGERRDIFDNALRGKIASIRSIEQDYDGRVHLAVVVDEDPGKDLGILRHPGHRFFFAPEEVDPIV